MSLQFPLPTKAKLIDVNPRSENHGDELVPAIDLRFQLDIDYVLLAALDPRLPDLLYELELQVLPDTQPTLPGVEAAPPQRVTMLRLPKLMQPLKWDDETPGYTLVIDYGIGGESNTELRDCKVHKHVITAKQGGTCTVAFTCSCAHDLTEQDVGRMGTRVQQDVHLTLMPVVCDAAQTAEAEV